MLIHLLRHGRTTLENHLLGQTNPELTPAGWAQTRAQIDRLAWSHIVTSPLRRAQEPALEAAGRAGAVCRIDRDWREMHFGDWDGLPIDDIRLTHGTAFKSFYDDPVTNPPPGGETWTELVGRVSRALQAIVAEPREAPVLVLTHAGAIRAALAAACAFPRESLWCFRVAHSSVVTIELQAGDGGKLWGEIVEIRQP